MSMQQQREINDLKQRVTEVEKKLAETAESLAYLTGKVLGGPEATLPTRKAARG